MHILLTNDDGIQSPGIRALYTIFIQKGHKVSLVAPLSEQSAVGHAITIAAPLRATEYNEESFSGMAVNGTPADCVKLGISTLLTEKPDIVVSGINRGCNVGVDILYSGTVSAATEGALMGFPALAVSLDSFNTTDFLEQAEYAEKILMQIPWHTIPKNTIMNLNFPNCALKDAKSLEICAPSQIPYTDNFETRLDPRKKEYYWMLPNLPMELVEKDSDRYLIHEKHITLSAISFQLTSEEGQTILRNLFVK